MKRVLAIVVLLFIFATLVHFLYTAFTGGSKESLLAHLFFAYDCTYGVLCITVGYKAYSERLAGKQI